MRFDYWQQFEYKNNKGLTVRDGIKFERLVKYLLELEYNCQWLQTGKSHDDNRDFYFYMQNECIWAECKNYRPKLSMSVIAPTLVMAQIYDVRTILFFSSSPFNKSARKKLYLYAEKANKKLHLYDGDTLFLLIQKHNDSLPDEFKIQPDMSLASIKLKPTCDFLYIQNPVVGIALEDRLIKPLSKAKTIYFNTTFEIAIVVQNPSAVACAEITVGAILPDGGQSAVDVYCPQLTSDVF